MIDALVAAWAVLSLEQRELFAALYSAAVNLNQWLGVPGVDPGAPREAPRVIVAQSPTSDVRAALEQFEELAERYRGIRLETLIGRTTPGVIPTWQAVERRASSSAESALPLTIALRDAYAALQANGGAVGARVDSAAARAWLLQRLADTYTAPAESSNVGLALLVLLGLWAMGRGK